MEWEFIAPMIVSTTFIITVGGVLVLRPIAKRVSDLLEVYARDRQSGVTNELHQVRDLLESIEGRMRLMEERQDFTERLIGSGGKADTAGRRGQRPRRPGLIRASSAARSSHCPRSMTPAGRRTTPRSERGSSSTRRRSALAPSRTLPKSAVRSTY